MCVCVFICGFCNVCVCVGFVMCGCFGNMYPVLWQVFLNLTEVFLTLTEIFPCFFLSCKANARVKLAKKGHGPHFSTLVVICVARLLFVLFYVLFCVNVYCHRVTTQLQLIYIYIYIYLFFFKEYVVPSDSSLTWVTLYKMPQHLRAHFLRPTTIGVIPLSFILISLHLRGTQVQPDLLCSMTATRKVPIKQPKVFKGMPVVIILVIITLMAFCVRIWHWLTQCIWNWHSSYSR